MARDGQLTELGGPASDRLHADDIIDSNGDSTCQLPTAAATLDKCKSSGGSQRDMRQLGRYYCV